VPGVSCAAIKQAQLCLDLLNMQRTETELNFSLEITFLGSCVKPKTVSRPSSARFFGDTTTSASNLSVCDLICPASCSPKPLSKELADSAKAKIYYVDSLFVVTLRYTIDLVFLDRARCPIAVECILRLLQHMFQVLSLSLKARSQLPYARFKTTKCFGFVSPPLTFLRDYDGNTLCGDCGRTNRRLFVAATWPSRGE